MNYINRFLYLFLLLLALSAEAQPPQPWQMHFQTPVTHNMHLLRDLHDFIMIILSGIILLILFLLAYICMKFHHKSNPTPAKFAHNVWLEVVWTLIPTIILVIIAIPSFKSLYSIEHTPSAEMTIKIVGYQWYWNYQYPDHNNLEFDSHIIADNQLQKGQLRLLDVDNRLVIPENTVVRLLITGADVIHSFAVPAFGIKMDAVPGRTNETWVKVEKPGVYYGQCSELCGINHGFMPIAVEVVSKPEFEQWLQSNNNHLQ